MCAIEAGKHGRRVSSWSTPRSGRKILISGGGRCNFTNLHTTAENFLSANPHFAKSALARYTPRDFIAMVERHGIRLPREDARAVVLRSPATEIVRMLEIECAAVGVRLPDGVRSVRNRRRRAVDPKWRHRANLQARCWSSPAEGFRFRKWGPRRSATKSRAGSACASWSAAPRWCPSRSAAPIASASCRPGAESTVGKSTGRARHARSAKNCSSRIADLAARRFSKRRLLAPGESVEIDLLPGVDFAGQLAAAAPWCASPRCELFWRAICPNAWPTGGANCEDIESHPQLSDREIGRALPRSLHAWRFQPAGTEGYEKAEVTGGGVDTAELSSQTMECRKVPGLYFIGEVVDVTGQLGGFNFQWAWASGAAAGRALPSAVFDASLDIRVGPLDEPVSAAASVAVPGLSFTWRMNLPVPCNKRAGSGSDAP